jgi:hypothetical protein
LLTEVAAARHPGKQAVVQAAATALKAALTSLTRTQVTAASAAAAATGGAAAALTGVVGSLGPDAQVWRLVSKAALFLMLLYPVLSWRGLKSLPLLLCTFPDLSQVLDSAGRQCG